MKDKSVQYPTYQTQSIDDCICPFCGEIFNGEKATGGFTHRPIIECPSCGKEMECFQSIEYTCTNIEDEE